MNVAVDLHVHERAVSADSRTPARAMMRAARTHLGEFAMIGFVGHDRRPRVQPNGTLFATGVEHEVRPPPNRLHVIEFPGQDFRILAHPKMTWPENTRERVHEYLVEHPEIEAVEKWRGGRRQFRGNVPALQIGSSDSHNPLLLGASHLIVETADVSTDGVFEAIRDGRFQAVNRPVGRLTRAAHTVEKAGAFVVSDPNAAARVGRAALAETF